jgi:hypothetical protein
MTHLLELDPLPRGNDRYTHPERKILSDPGAQSAFVSYPTTELVDAHAVVDKFYPQDNISRDYYYADILFRIIMIRMLYSYCNACGRTSAAGYLLRRCSKCHITYYCNYKCYRQDWENHKEWCCNDDAPVKQDCKYRSLLLTEAFKKSAIDPEIIWSTISKR